MKTSIKNRLLRLGILCAGIGSFAVAIFAAAAMTYIQSVSSDAFGRTVAGSVVSSLQEEMEYLPDGLRDASAGEHNDIFDNVFEIGQPQRYDYSAFEQECRELPENGVLVTYISSEEVYVVALNRGKDIIAGELESDYFDYAVNIMADNNCYGYMINNRNGNIILSTDKTQCGGSISGDQLYKKCFDAAAAGKSASTGGPFSKFIIYAAVLPDNPEFSVFYCTKSENVYKSGTVVIILMLLWAAVLTTVGVIVSVGVAKKIAGSILPTVDCLDRFSRGEIDTSFRRNDRGDETELLSQAMETTIANLGTYIKDIDHRLSEMSNGNLTSESTCEYRGDFNNIRVSLDNISSSLRETVGTIREAGEQVNSGVSSLAGGAQSLAENSNNEAATLRELDVLVKNINDDVNANAEMTNRMRSLSETAVANVETGNRNMQDLSSAIEDIRKASQEIQSIANLIDDIAFQTNILALNAAVEAARAGSAGKGFAVVADEVRNLAGKSADAAQEAVKVIDRSVAAAELGVNLNESVNSSLDAVRRSVREFSDLVGMVADSSNRQAKDISTVTDGLSNITGAVQSNAATAEQSAASSEEIASQAQVLEHQLMKFRI